MKFWKLPAYFNFPTLVTSGVILQMPSISAALVGWLSGVTGLAVSSLTASVILPVVGMLTAGAVVHQLHQRLPQGELVVGAVVAAMLYPLLSPMAALAAGFGAISFGNGGSDFLRVGFNLLAVAMVIAAPWLGVTALIGGGIAAGASMLSAQVLARLGVTLTLEHLAIGMGITAFGARIVGLFHNMAARLNLPVMVATGVILQMTGATAAMSSIVAQVTGLAWAGALLGGGLAPLCAMVVAGCAIQKGLNKLYNPNHMYFINTVKSLVTGMVVGGGLLLCLDPLVALSYGLCAMAAQNSLSTKAATRLGTMTLLATLAAPFVGLAGRAAQVLGWGLSAGTRALATQEIVMTTSQVAMVTGSVAAVTTLFNARAVQFTPAEILLVEQQQQSTLGL